VFATLEQKQASYAVTAVASGQRRSPPHIALHPFGRAPVLEHDGFMLYETQAILRYLDRVIPSPSLPPADAKAAARVDQVLSINDWYLFQGVANVIVFQRVIDPKLLGLTPNEEAIAAAMPRAQVVIDELSRLLGGHEFFAGPSLSLADMELAPQLDLFSETPEWQSPTALHANMTRWLSRMRGRPSLKATTRESVDVMGKALHRDWEGQTTPDLDFSRPTG
jgi:glutathione S-transferase